MNARDIRFSEHQMHGVSSGAWLALTKLVWLRSICSQHFLQGPRKVSGLALKRIPTYYGLALSLCIAEIRWVSRNTRNILICSVAVTSTEIKLPSGGGLSWKGGKTSWASLSLTSPQTMIPSRRNSSEKASARRTGRSSWESQVKRRSLSYMWETTSKHEEIRTDLNFKGTSDCIRVV